MFHRKQTKDTGYPEVRKDFQKGNPPTMSSIKRFPLDVATKRTV